MIRNFATQSCTERDWLKFWQLKNEIQLQIYRFYVEIVQFLVFFTRKISSLHILVGKPARLAHRFHRFFLWL